MKTLGGGMAAACSVWGDCGWCQCEIILPDAAGRESSACCADEGLAIAQVREWMGSHALWRYSYCDRGGEGCSAGLWEPGDGSKAATDCRCAEVRRVGLPRSEEQRRHPRCGVPSSLGDGRNDTAAGRERRHIARPVPHVVQEDEVRLRAR